MSQRFALGGTLFVLVAVGITVAWFGIFVLADRPTGGTTAQLAIGEDVYLQHCAACHGVNLEGQPNWRTPGPDGLLPAPPHNDTGHTWHHTTELLFAITKYGVARAANLGDYPSAMPAYEGILTDAEINAALAYIKSRWPEELQEQHGRLDQRNSN